MCPLLILTLPDSPASDLMPQDKSFLWLAGIVILIEFQSSPRAPEHGAPHRETGLLWAFSGK
jgi:hypothetical protein